MSTVTTADPLAGIASETHDPGPVSHLFPGKPGEPIPQVAAVAACGFVKDPPHLDYDGSPYRPCAECVRAIEAEGGVIHS
jgi:hypothetical protein